jgi:hypothetical protein
LAHLPNWGDESGNGYIRYEPWWKYETRNWFSMTLAGFVWFKMTSTTVALQFPEFLLKLEGYVGRLSGLCWKLVSLISHCCCGPIQRIGIWVKGKMNLQSPLVQFDGNLEKNRTGYWCHDFSDQLHGFCCGFLIGSGIQLLGSPASTEMSLSHNTTKGNPIFHTRFRNHSESLCVTRMSQSQY